MMYGTQTKPCHAKAIVAAVSLLLAGGLMTAPAVAQTPQEKAHAHNDAYNPSTNGYPPETMAEYLLCSELWDRWNSGVTNSNEPAFTTALRRELQSANATNRKIFWQRLARRELGQDDPEMFDGFQNAEGRRADLIYGAYVKQREGSMESLMSRLSWCK